MRPSCNHGAHNASHPSTSLPLFQHSTAQTLPRCPAPRHCQLAVLGRHHTAASSWCPNRRRTTGQHSQVHLGSDPARAIVAKGWSSPWAAMARGWSWPCATMAGRSSWPHADDEEVEQSLVCQWRSDSVHLGRNNFLDLEVQDEPASGGNILVMGWT